MLKATSFNEKGIQSPVIDRTFLKAQPIPAKNLGRLEKGLKVKFYFGLWDKVPDFDDLIAGKAKSSRNFDLEVREQNDAFGLVFEGYIQVPLTDVYTFTTVSDDGSKLYVNGQLVVDNDGQHSPQRQSGQIGLAAGYHSIRLDYFEGGGGEELKVYWAGSAIPEEEIPSKVLFYVD